MSRSRIGIKGKRFRDTQDLRYWEKSKDTTSFDSQLSSSSEDSSANKNFGYTPDDMNESGELEASTFSIGSRLLRDTQGPIPKDSSANKNFGYTPDDMNESGELESSTSSIGSKLLRDTRGPIPKIQTTFDPDLSSSSERTDENQVHVSFQGTNPRPGTSTAMVTPNGLSSHGSQTYFKTQNPNIYFGTQGPSTRTMEEEETSEIEERSRPFSWNNPQPGPSTEVPHTTFEIEEQKPKSRISLLKIALFTFLALGAITAIIVLIIALRDLTPPAPVCIGEVEIPLMTPIVLTCNLKKYKEKNVTIQISPPRQGNKTVNLQLGSTAENQTWTMNESSDSETSVQIWGPKMQCNSSGTYQIDFIDGGKNVKTQTVNIAISRNIAMVLLEVNRATSCTSYDNGTDLYVSCATHGDCEQSSLSFLGIVEKNGGDKIEMQLEHAFICSNNYTSTSGRSINCSGTIPAAIAGKINAIKCHRSSSQLTEKQQNDVDATKSLQTCIANRCMARGIRLDEIIIIICNFSYVLVSNISISVDPPPPANYRVDLTSQNNTQNGWTMDNTTGTNGRNLTLRGPKANCSSAGVYKISINDSQHVIMQENVTVQLKGYSNCTVTTNSNGTAECESRTDCDGSYTLRMDPCSIHPTINFSHICRTKYSDSSGWTTSCGITTPDVYNVSVKCTLSDNKILNPSTLYLSHPCNECP